MSEGHYSKCRYAQKRNGTIDYTYVGKQRRNLFLLCYSSMALGIKKNRTPGFVQDITVRYPIACWRIAWSLGEEHVSKKKKKMILRSRTEA